MPAHEEGHEDPLSIASWPTMIRFISNSALSRVLRARLESGKRPSDGSLSLTMVSSCLPRSTAGELSVCRPGAPTAHEFQRHGGARWRCLDAGCKVVHVVHRIPVDRRDDVARLEARPFRRSVRLHIGDERAALTGRRAVAGDPEEAELRGPTIE